MAGGENAALASRVLHGAIQAAAPAWGEVGAVGLVLLKGKRGWTRRFRAKSESKCSLNAP